MKNETPAEPFKRAVASAVRSLAGEPHLEVSYSAEPPSLKGMKARLPLPSRNPPPSEVAVVRGQGDAFALRLAYHKDALHQKYRPKASDAAAIFEAAEQARVEAIGTRAMVGVAANLTAWLEARLGASSIAKTRTRADASLAEVIALIVRERLTGLPPPDCARTAVASWRDWIEERAGADLDRIEAAYRDQKSFAKLTRSILKDLQLADDLAQDCEGEAGDSCEPEQQPQERPEEADTGKGEPADATESATEAESSDE